MITTKCYFFGREIPRDAFWAKYGWIFAFPFLLIGFILAIKPDWLVKLQIWWLKLFGAKFEPGKLISKIYRAIGIGWIILGLGFLFLALYYNLR